MTIAHITIEQAKAIWPILSIQQCQGANLKIDKANAELQLKQVSWSSVPAGVAVIAVDSDGENACLGQIRYASSSHCVVERASNTAGCNSASYDVNLLKLAPASEQPWIAVQDARSIIGLSREFDSAGLTYEFDQMRFRITGLEEGATK